MSTNRPESIIINNPEVSALLKNMQAIFYLKPFFDKPQSLQEAAKEVGISMSTYYYWIKKFLNLGLLTIAFEKPRAGSNIKYYSAPAKSIVVKIDNSSFSLKEFYDSYVSKYDIYNLIAETTYLSLLDSQKEYGVLLYSDRRKRFYSKLITLNEEEKKNTIENELLGFNAPATMATWREMSLNYADAKNFQKDLVSLLAQYEGKEILGQKKYLVQVALAPNK